MNTYKHRGGFGDLILGLPTVIALGGGTFYLYDKQREQLGELLDRQSYLQVEQLSFAEWKQFEVTHNLDKFREVSEVSVAKMHLKAFNVDFDLTRPWLFNIEPLKVAKIVIHDTGDQRTPGHTVNWELLRPYLKDCVFIGYKNDYDDFVQNRGLNVEWYQTETLYDIARVIAGANLMVCNQSAPYTIAEGLKIPLALDLYIGKPQYPLHPDHGYVGLCYEIFRRHLPL